MAPLMCLIVSTVAPGTWEIRDGSGTDVTAQSGLDDTSVGPGGQTKRTGTMVPFFLSISLIVECDVGTHAQVANLLRGLRDFVNTRENNGRSQVMERRDPIVTQIGSGPVASPSRPANGAAAAGREASTKIERLLDELRTEIAKLPRRPE